MAAGDVHPAIEAPVHKEDAHVQTSAAMETTAKRRWKCSACGHIHEGEEEHGPDGCSKCGAPKAAMVLQSDDAQPDSEEATEKSSVLAPAPRAVEASSPKRDEPEEQSDTAKATQELIDIHPTIRNRVVSGMVRDDWIKLSVFEKLALVKETMKDMPDADELNGYVDMVKNAPDSHKLEDILKCPVTGQEGDACAREGDLPPNPCSFAAGGGNGDEKCTVM